MQCFNSEGPVVQVVTIPKDRSGIYTKLCAKER